VLTLGRLEELRDRFAAVPLAERREIAGLHPDRAPTIVAGMLILIEALHVFGLGLVQVSERDILWGAALEALR
jgi:exopolyphosphatase/guanosine-5'-triphosphate,3'-diphosphate pyrophosphatase